MQVIHSNYSAIQTLCDYHKVKELYVFGSVLTPSFSANSDIDVLVQFEPMRLEDYFDHQVITKSFRKNEPRLLEITSFNTEFLRNAWPLKAQGIRK